MKVKILIVMHKSTVVTNDDGDDRDVKWKDISNCKEL
jgi:hypothetical protein